MKNPGLQALFQIHRAQMLLHSKDATGRWNFPPPYLYAIAMYVAPIFHSSGGEDADPFHECYEVSYSSVEDVANWLDEEWSARRTPTFYELERHFGHDRRVDLIRIVRYCALDGQMDPNFWTGLLKNQECPVEALHAADPFDEAELRIV